MSGHLAETEADIEVKDRLWEATRREAIRYAEQFAEAHEVGVRYSEGQREIASRAKRKGYPKVLICELGAFIRRGALSSDRASAVLNGYRGALDI